MAKPTSHTDTLEFRLDRTAHLPEDALPLEDWLSKKRQYEMFTDRNGRPCQASDYSLVAAMFRLMPKSLEETVMFANEDEGVQELCDRLAGLQQHEAVDTNERKQEKHKER